MRQALDVFCATGSEAGLLQQFRLMESRVGDLSGSGLARIVWSFIAQKALAGQIEITGHFGGPDARCIEPGLLLGALADFDRHTLTTTAGVFAGVLVRQVPIAIAQPSPGDPLASDDVTRAAAWMASNVTAYAPNQRDGRIKQCMAAVQVGKRAALAGWSTLPDRLRGRSRQAK